MSVQTRQKGRRSLSIFSIDYTRMSSKRRTLPDTSCARHSVFHSSRNLSCDPYNQSLNVPTPVTRVSHISIQGLISCPAVHEPEKMAFAHLLGKASKDETEAGKRARLRSLLPHISLSGRSTRHSSNLTQSVISGPILTATTNATVAEAEGLHCQDITDLGLVPPTENPVQPADLASEHDHTDQTQKNLSRFASLFNIRKNKTDKGASFSSDVPSTSVSTHHSEENPVPSTFEQDIERRKAEAANLASKKVNKFTGHGIIKRKLIGDDNSNTLSKSKEIESHDNIGDQSAGPHIAAEVPKFLSFNHSRSDLTFASMNKSIAEAVDKLDPRTIRPAASMNFVKSKSSIFNFPKSKRAEKDNESRVESAKDHGSTSFTESQPNAKSERDQGTAILTMTEALKQIRPPVHHHDRPHPVGAPPEPLQFSQAENTYVAAQPIKEYPGGVKVLGTHSNPMEFATAPSWVTDLSKPPTHTPTLGEVLTIGEDDEHVIQDAPIYSPSLGDLSQYARPTPPSQQPSIERPQGVEPETPSHAQAEKSLRRRLGLRKSKSGLGLLGMFGKEQSEAKERGRPLQPREANQKMDRTPDLRKSRSMNLTALLRKGDSSSVKEPLLQEDQQMPVPLFRPSPLRYQAEVGNTQFTTASDAEVVKRTPPKGSITPSDRAKRMGMVGMPGENPDEA